MKISFRRCGDGSSGGSGSGGDGLSKKETKQGEEARAR